MDMRFFVVVVFLKTVSNIKLIHLTTYINTQKH